MLTKSMAGHIPVYLPHGSNGYDNFITKMDSPLHREINLRPYSYKPLGL